MEAVASRPLALLSRRRLISVIVVALSCGLTAAMSLLFERGIDPVMMLTGFVAAVVINAVIDRMTRHYRQRLRDAHASLEHRVRDAIAETHALRDELNVRDRMATAGVLAAGVSHEIRSPLGVIRIAVDEVSELLGNPPYEVKQYLKDISEASDRIATILRDLTSLARPVDDPVTAVDLREVIDSSSRLASYRFGNGVTLEPPAIDAPPVSGNASRIAQLVTNLLHNAARAKRPDVTNTITVSTQTLDHSVVLRVSDSGTGMTDDTKSKLFTPFFTTGASTGGTGLGLTICKSLVEKMGGSIAVDSELGQGTTVSVTLRRAEPRRRDPSAIIDV